MHQIEEGVEDPLFVLAMQDRALNPMRPSGKTEVRMTRSMLKDMHNLAEAPEAVVDTDLLVENQALRMDVAKANQNTLRLEAKIEALEKEKTNNGWDKKGCNTRLMKRPRVKLSKERAKKNRCPQRLLQRT